MSYPSTREIYLEVGAKRVFAGAVEWPGWCRSARDEVGAQEALLAAAPRYAAVLRGRLAGFVPPASAESFDIVERLPGDTTTDFGAPAQVPAADERPVSAAELKRLKAILEASWAALDRAAEAAAGVELRKGPRGGGRELEGVLDHVAGAEGGYLRSLGVTGLKLPLLDARSAVDDLRAAVLDGLARSVAGELPAVGPRGGARWTARYFVRRATWHVLDHVWEIEDRAAPA
jgi:hypothetical protein